MTFKRERAAPAGLPSRHRGLLRDGIAWASEFIQDRFRREQNQQIRDLLTFLGHRFIVPATLFRPILKAIAGKNVSRLKLQGSRQQLFPLISSRKRVSLVHRLAGKAHMSRPPGGVPGIICRNRNCRVMCAPQGSGGEHRVKWHPGANIGWGVSNSGAAHLGLS
jgi:hypothetical protein